MIRPVLRSAFTLLELLLVITVISVLLALLLPALQNARETGRRVVCTGNQRQMAVALLRFESARQSFPGFLNTLPAAAPARQPGEPRSAPAADVSWVVSLLPDLGRKDLYNACLQTTPERSGAADFVSTPIGVLVCPSDPPASLGPGSCWLSYVVNRGRNGWNDNPGVGVCFDDRSGLGPRRASVGLRYLNEHDGAATTLLLSESLLTPPESAQGTDRTGRPPYLHLLEANGSAPPADSRHNPPTPKLTPVHYYRPFSAWWGPIAAPGCAATGDCLDELTLGFEWSSLGTRNDAKLTDQIASLHPGIVMATFCDGHQSPLRNDLDVNVFKHIMSPNDAEYKGADAPPSGQTWDESGRR